MVSRLPSLGHGDFTRAQWEHGASATVVPVLADADLSANSAEVVAFISRPVTGSTSAPIAPPIPGPRQPRGTHHQRKGIPMPNYETTSTRRAARLSPPRQAIALTTEAGCRPAVPRN